MHRHVTALYYNMLPMLPLCCLILIPYITYVTYYRYRLHWLEPECMFPACIRAFCFASMPFRLYIIIYLRSYKYIYINYFIYVCVLYTYTVPGEHTRYIKYNHGWRRQWICIIFFKHFLFFTLSIQSRFDYTAVYILIIIYYTIFIHRIYGICF